MRTREEVFHELLSSGCVRLAFEYALDYAIAAADLPDRRGIDIDSSQRLRDCLDRAIDSLKESRRMV